MANPIQFTIVSAVPFISGEALLATRVENRGESAITTIPQKSIKPRNKYSDSKPKAQGEKTQHPRDKRRAVKAVDFTPALCETYPPRTQPRLPTAMIKNDHKGMFKEVVIDISE